MCELLLSLIRTCSLRGKSSSSSFLHSKVASHFTMKERWWRRVTHSEPGLPMVPCPNWDMECTNYICIKQGKYAKLPRKWGGWNLLSWELAKQDGQGPGRSMTVLYSGLAGNDAPLEKGVALILSKAAGKSLKEWEPISERITSARLESNTPFTPKFKHV